MSATSKHNFKFAIGDIITHENPKRENIPWVVVGFTTFKKVNSIGYYYKLVALQRLDEINYPFEIDFEQAHCYYVRAT